MTLSEIVHNQPDYKNPSTYSEASRYFRVGVGKKNRFEIPGSHSEVNDETRVLMAREKMLKQVQHDQKTKVQLKPHPVPKHRNVSGSE